MKGAIIYVSSNKEYPQFEQRIIENIQQHAGDLEVISVTQKPMNFGKNICVGDDIGVSGFNMFRQVLIGMQATDADYIISCEADCLYPPEYFKFVPPRLDIPYRNTNTYVMPQHRKVFWHKPESATHAQIVGREFYVKRLEHLFKDAPMWSADERNFPKERTGEEDIFDHIEFFKTEAPVVQIKTSQSMRNYTRSERVDVPSLPYWGNARDFRKKYYDIGFIH